MTWGARMLVIAATAALLLQLDTWYTLAATVERKPWLITRSSNSTSVAVAEKARPVSGDSEILIEHVDDDDSVVLMPLVVAVLVLVAFVFVVLLVLACLLVMRLLESRKGTKYHRLHSSETYGSETYERRRHRSRTGRSKQSQVFTYVDLSNAECSCLEHGVEGGKENVQQAPRFAVQFQSATNVDVNDANARRDRQEAPAPAPRRSRMATMGLPSGEHDAAEDAQQLRRAQVAESNANAASQSADVPSDHPVESPTLRMYAENAAWGSPGNRSDSIGEAAEFDIFRERCAKFTSVVPRVEIQVRDRCVKKHPSSGSRKSPMKYRGFDREIEKVMTAHTTDASGTTYPGLYISLPSDMGSPRESYDVSSDVQSSPEFSPSGPIASAPAIGAASVSTSPFRAEDADVSSCGQYHRNRDYGEAGNAVTTSVTERQSSEVSSASRDYEKFPTEASPTKPGHSVNALMELPDTRVAPRNGSALKPSNSARLRELFEREAAKARLSDAAIRKPAASTSSSRDLSVQVPQMVAYFDRARTEKSLKAATEGTSESQAATRSLSTDASLTTVPEAEPPAPVSSAKIIAASTGRIRLPQPPIERSKKDIHVRLQDEELAARSESSQPPRARHDDQSSTEPFSIEEMSRQRASASEPLSDGDFPSDHVEARKVEILSPSVPPRSKASFVSSDVPQSNDTAMSSVDDERSALRAAAEEHELRERRSPQLVKPGDSPRKQSVDSYSKSAAPYAREDSKSVVHTDSHVGQTRESAAVVSPFDSPESAPHISPGAPSHVEKASVALPSSLPSKGVDTARPIVAKDDDSVQPSAESSAVLEGGVRGNVAQRGGDSDTGISGSMTAVPTHGIDFRRQQDVAPVHSSAKEGEYSLTPVQPPEFPLSSTSEDTVGLISAHDVKKGPSNLVQPLIPEQQELVQDQENSVALRDRRDFPVSGQEPNDIVNPEREPESQLIRGKVSDIDKREAHLLTDIAETRYEVSDTQSAINKQASTRTGETDKEHGEVTSYDARNLEDRLVRQTVRPRAERSPAMYSAPPQMILRAATPSPRNQTDTALAMRPEYKAPGEAREGLVRDAVKVKETRITSTGNETRWVRKSDIDAGDLDQRVPHQVRTSAEDSQSSMEEYDARRRSLSEASPPSVPDRRVFSLQKDGAVLGRTEHDALVDRKEMSGVNVQHTQVSGRPTASTDELTLPGSTETYPRKGSTVIGPKAEVQEPIVGKISPLPSDRHEEKTALDDSSRPSLGEKLVKQPIAPTMQLPPVMTTTPPQMLLHGPIPKTWDGTNTALMSRQEYTVPGETAGGPFKEVVPVHSVPVTKEDDQPLMTQDPDIGIRSIAQKDTQGVRASDEHSVESFTPYDRESRGLAEPAPSTAPEESTRLRTDDKVSSQVESGAPADREREAEITEVRSELAGRRVGPISEPAPAGPPDAYSSTLESSVTTAATKEEVIPVNRQPLLTARDDKGRPEIDKASEPRLESRSVKVSAPKTEPPPVTDIPPPQMLLSGPLPNLWGGTDALISREEYTVPGEVTGGPFSASGKGPSVDSESPASPGSRFPVGHRQSTEGTTATDQRWNMAKTERRRSSWADSFQSRPPSVARSLHSSVELSHPPNDHLSDVHRTTSFLSDTVTAHQGDEKREAPDGTRSGVSGLAEFQVQGAVPSEPSPPQSVEARNGTVLPRTQKAPPMPAHDRQPVLSKKGQTSPEGTQTLREHESRLPKRGDADVDDKLQPQSEDDVPAELLAALETPSGKTTGVSSPTKLPSIAGRYDDTTTLTESPKSNMTDPRREQRVHPAEKTTPDFPLTSKDNAHATPPASGTLTELDSEPLAGVSANQHGLEALADAGPNQQQNLSPIERVSRELSSTERQPDELTSVLKQALEQPVSQPPAGLNSDTTEVKAALTNQPVTASHVQPKWSPIEKRKQEFLANANRSRQPKVRSGQALAEPAEELPITAEKREIAKPHPGRENVDAIWQAKWSPTERSSQEASPAETPKRHRTLLPKPTVIQPKSEKPVVVSNGKQQEIATPPSRQLGADLSRQPQWYPLERTVQGPPSNVTLQKPSSTHAMTQTPQAKRPSKVKADRLRHITPPSQEIVIDESKPSLVQAAADSGSVAAISRDERDVTPIHDSATTSRMIKPSDNLEHSVAPLEVRPAPSDATSSQPLTEASTPKSPDVFFGKTTPVSTNGSKDLMQFKHEEATDSPEATPEEKRTKKLSESHNVEETDLKDEKYPTTEPKK